MTRPRVRSDASSLHAAHEWLSLEDPDGSIWLFDLTFLASNWRCVWGSGCPGIEAEPDVERGLGCCGHGAYFADDADRARVTAAVAHLDPQHWQQAADAGSWLEVDEDGTAKTAVVEGACVFANGPGFDGGAGCALHLGALAAGAAPHTWKPEVCWQLPLRLESSVDEHGGLTYVLREWKRRDWGEGGEEFHWWCTETPLAFDGGSPVYESLRDELIALIGEDRYAALVDYLRSRRAEYLLPHPVVRRR